MIKYLQSGPVTVILAFVLWGITPLFYSYLSGGSLIHIFVYRVLFSIPLLLAIRFFIHKKTFFRDLLKDKKSFVFCIIAGLLMITSWLSFIYALTNHRVLMASLGYFINPLFVILLGSIILKEKISLCQIIAIFSGVCGLIFQLFSTNNIPVLALIMGGAFALYGLARKFIYYDAITSVTLETFLALPVALFILIYMNQSMSPPSDIPCILYIMTAPVTIIPLVLFAVALNHTSLIVTGLAQYIEPSIQFLTAVVILGETVNHVELFCFSAVWFGLLLCIIESFYRNYRQHNHHENTIR
ncbi:EamA family transporter RarD [Escherichia albertii]|uniref:EamA family transporter RarD n=1 Tax=Escherichia albertii TaxID=208962 RepID=UPI0030C9E521